MSAQRACLILALLGSASSSALAGSLSTSSGVEVEVEQVDAPSGTVCRFSVRNGSGWAITHFVVGWGRRNPFARNAVPAPALYLALDQQVSPEGWLPTLGAGSAFSLTWTGKAEGVAIAPGADLVFTLVLLPESEHVPCDQLRWFTRKAVRAPPTYVRPPTAATARRAPATPLPIPSLSPAVLACCTGMVTERSPVRPSAAELMAAFRIGTGPLASKGFVFQGDIAEALIALGDKAVMSELKDLLRSDWRETRVNAAWVLAKLGDDEGFGMVMAEARDPSPDGRSEGRGGESPPSQQMLMRQINQDRYYAVRTLGMMGDRRAVPLLCELVHDRDLDAGAAYALSQINDLAPSRRCVRLRPRTGANRGSTSRRRWRSWAIDAVKKCCSRSSATQGLIPISVSCRQSRWAG